MSSAEQLSVEEASRLAVRATTVDLEYWARSFAVDGQIGLNDLVGVLRAFSADTVQEPTATADYPTAEAS
jgi:hypothetical protein